MLLNFVKSFIVIMSMGIVDPAFLDDKAPGGIAPAENSVAEVESVAVELEHDTAPVILHATQHAPALWCSAFGFTADVPDAWSLGETQKRQQILDMTVANLAEPETEEAVRESIAPLLFESETEVLLLDDAEENPDYLMAFTREGAFPENPALLNVLKLQIKRIAEQRILDSLGAARNVEALEVVQRCGRTMLMFEFNGIAQDSRMIQCVMNYDAERCLLLTLNSKKENYEVNRRTFLTMLDSMALAE